MITGQPTPPQDPAHQTIPVRNVWHMFMYAFDLLKLSGKFKSSIESAPSPRLLIAHLLAECMEKRLRVGLYRSYVDGERELGAVRGRIDINRSLRTNAFERGRVFCRFQEYSADNPRNRLIKGSILRLLVDLEKQRSLQHDNTLTRRLRRLFANMAEVSVGSVSREAFRREAYGRNDVGDRLILALCELHFLSYMPTESEGTAYLLQTQPDGRLLYMLFERFVAQFLKWHLLPMGWLVQSQKTLKWPVKDSTQRMREHIPDMKIDLLMTAPSRDRQIILDTKFTNVLTKGRTGKLIFKSEHLYQLYAYLRSQEARLPWCREGILLYPAVGGNDFQEDAFMQGIRLRILTVDLAQQWADIERSLLSIFGLTMQG